MYGVIWSSHIKHSVIDSARNGHIGLACLKMLEVVTGADCSEQKQVVKSARML